MVEATQVNATNKSKCKKFKSKGIHAGHSHKLLSALLSTKDNWGPVLRWPGTPSVCAPTCSPPLECGWDLQKLNLTQRPLLLLW